MFYFIKLNYFDSGKFLGFVITKEKKTSLKMEMCSISLWFPILGQAALLKFWPISKYLFSPPFLVSFFPKPVIMLSVSSHFSPRYFLKACPQYRNLWYKELCWASKDACKTLHIHTPKCSKWFVFLPKNTWTFLVFSKG